MSSEVQDSLADPIQEAILRLRPSPDAIASLRHLSALKPAEVSYLPRKRTAAVLVLLYVDEQQGKRLSVLLTTRALHLRTSPGETALPGGRMEAEDATVHDTALREACEEVGLSRNTPLLHLTTLAPFLSYTLLYVVPVVYLLAAPSQNIVNALTPNPAEVSAIFSAGLSRFVGTGTQEAKAYAHSYHDVPWLNDKPFRLHDYCDDTFASDVTGLTADILLTTALAAVGPSAESGFERMADGQMSWADLVQHVLDGKTSKPRQK